MTYIQLYNFSKNFSRNLNIVFLDIFYDFSVGGSIKEDITSCWKIFRGGASTEEVLKCTHEEPDDRVFFHVNDDIKRDDFIKMVVASPDTDIFLNAVYHFTEWIYCGLEELWISSGKPVGKQAFPVHDLVRAVLMMFYRLFIH